MNGASTTLDDPDAFPDGSTRAASINNLGQIVGSYYDSLGNIHGFVLDHGVYTTIDGPIGSGATATGINNLGQIVGITWMPTTIVTDSFWITALTPQ